MGWKLTDWPIAVRDAPKMARSRLLVALHQAQGVLGSTAKILGLGIRTVNTYLDILDLREEAVKIRAANGIPARGWAGPRRKVVTRRKKAGAKRRRSP